ncbi:hypothetical protein SAMN05444266_107491 [Chitinophaga jiangningensis]|uniref:Por secretion system C-terminal sorting domain-containing protein n=1 Tax=Chitinophaga jiangningensis TaxID=1419482 RepID=A0A1M7I378_9BACT|nr:hypothetical protein [Chitinophaga jiangningensis]SHM35232.1 hypothetical protein SAMN05444266_107491 [Chitinophaga jiangningensis]
MKFVLAPKVSVILTGAILFGTLNAAAQDNVLAFNKLKSEYRTENGSPRATTAVNMQLNQQSKDALLFRLSVENPENEKLILYIKDKNNFTLHREVLPATVRYVGSYNLESLEDGDYSFEIRSGKNKIMEKFVEIHTSTVVNRNASVE